MFPEPSSQGQLRPQVAVRPRALLRRDASWHVVLAVRDPARGRAAMEELGSQTGVRFSRWSVCSFVGTVRTSRRCRRFVPRVQCRPVKPARFTDDGVEMMLG